MNGSSNTSIESCDLDLLSSVLMATVNSIFSFMGVIGNLLVLLAVYKTKDLQTVSNAYLVILAIADLLTSAIAQPLLIAMLIQEAKEECDETLITAFRAVGNFTCAVSFLVLCSITTERFLAVVKPMVYRNFHPKRRFYILTTISVILPLLYTILRVAGKKKATSYFSAIIFVIGYIYILSCYLTILIQLRLHSIKMTRETTSEQETTTRRHQAEKVVSVTMAIVIGIFTVMWLPLFYFRLARPSSNSGVGYNWVRTTALSNSALNPIVYALRMEAFRKSFKHVVDGGLHSMIFWSPSNMATQSTS